VLRFQALTAVKITLKMNAIRSSETVVTAYKFARRQNPEDHSRHPEVSFMRRKQISRRYDLEHNNGNIYRYGYRLSQACEALNIGHAHMQYATGCGLYTALLGWVIINNTGCHP
jgi:hypothetical protein